ncbi:MAG: sigma-70 family RNA polymerase sigma factor [Actinomycetota bacterium]
MARNRPVSAVDAAFRTEWTRLVATLTRELRDLQLAEDAAQEAFVEASRRWRTDGPPRSPGAWLLTTARRKAIDVVRRDRRFADRLPVLAEADDAAPSGQRLVDDQLALVFGCCHPALAVDLQVALTLRSVAGLTTEQIAHAFLVPVPTMAKRLVRAKHKLRAAAIPFVVPEPEHLQSRLAAVCGVVYAIFTEGHTSSSGRSLLRGNLCDEAIFLAETLAELLPAEGEARGLAALCLLTDARRLTREDDEGRPVLLPDQDRDRWDREQIDRGLRHLLAAHTTGSAGTYELQATIAALHATAPTYAATDWRAIVTIYDTMLRSGGGPVVALNRAAAIAEWRGPRAGLAALDELDADALHDYPYLHSARAELLTRSGDDAAALPAYDRAIEHAGNEAQRSWLADRRAEAAARIRSG